MKNTERWCGDGPVARSHPSGASVSDGHLSIDDDDGNVPATFPVAEHLLQESVILLHVPVVDAVPLGCVGLTGPVRVRSG